MSTITYANRRKTKIPLMLFEDLPDGRFAVRADETLDHTFLRVSRPNKGKLAGCIKVQTQHGEDLKDAFVMYPNQSIWWSNLTIEDDLMLALLNPLKWGREYAKVIGRCCVCAKELTDPRSRYYGIGPDCETRHEDIISYVDEQEGPYIP